MIKLSDDEIDILGKPNFACAKMAKLLIADGQYDDRSKKAEYEQAVFIHWASDLLDKHGPAWRFEGNLLLKGCAERITDTPLTHKD